ncbi:MAG: hypothetical protein ACUVV4_07650 [Candidatus Bathyarchaeia archaeon]
MKKILFPVVVLALMLVSPVMSKPVTYTVTYYEKQFQWRSTSWGGPFGQWSWIGPSFETESEFRITGNALHTGITYSPSVTDLVGASTVYVFAKESGYWIQREGTISYTSPYSGFTITEYWRGYLHLDENGDIVHGVGYQWGYVYGLDEETVKKKYPYAVWDETMGAWLAGFSIYLWDPVGHDQGIYNIPFPDPFIEPVPAKNYNPLGL